MEEKITVVVCSRNTADEKKEFLEHLRDSCGYNVHVVFLINTDGVSLTKIYSDILNKVDTNIVIFIHDDIEFLKNGWGFEIVRLFSTYKDYGIIGIAGSSEFDKNCAWWNYKNKYGQVLHRHDGKSWLSAFSPLLKDDLKEVCVIDGLFIAIEKNRISKNFDTDFSGFDHYDTSFCLSNYFDGKCKIGVTTNIRVAHNSVGELKENWFVNKEKLIEKYGDKLPIKIE